MCHVVKMDRTNHCFFAHQTLIRGFNFWRYRWQQSPTGLSLTTSMGDMHCPTPEKKQINRFTLQGIEQTNPTFTSKLSALAKQWSWLESYQRNLPVDFFFFSQNSGKYWVYSPVHIGVRLKTNDNLLITASCRGIAMVLKFFPSS